MQVHLVTGQKLSTWRKTPILTMLVLLITLLVGQYYAISYSTLLAIYLALIAFNFYASAHMIYYTVDELKRILDIDVFTIEKQVARANNDSSKNN